MSDATRAYLGSWPEFYDRLLVPVLFEPYARLLAGRLQGMTSGNVLEIAAGTGVVTRELIRTLPETVAITATDLNQPMLDRAQSYAGAERVRWQQADALALPFGDCTFECIVCQFGVMFFADKQAAFREALRVLKPDGRFLFSVWDRREEIAIQYIASEVVGRLLSLDPGSLLSPPYHDRVAVYSDLAAGGLLASASRHCPSAPVQIPPEKLQSPPVTVQCSVATSSRTLQIASKRSLTQWPLLWLSGMARGRSMLRCRRSCSTSFRPTAL